MLHLIFLHETGSSNPLNISYSEKVIFFPFFIVKDLVGFVASFFFFYFFFNYFKFLIKEEQNFIFAKFLVTPEHIQPEWYFLAAYAILRAVPKKLGGVILLVLFIFIFFFISFLNKKKNFLIFNKGILRFIFFF
jgi:ubiquinol-cytochrome c reductase cytochrome b subunit